MGQDCSSRRGELLFLPLLSPEQGPATGVDWTESGRLSSLCTVARCRATDLSSINFPQTGQPALLVPRAVPGVGEGGAVSEGVGRQEGGEEEEQLPPADSLRQLRVLLTGSVLTDRIGRRVRGMAGVNISHCLGCFSVDLRAPVLPVLGLTRVPTLGVSLK